MIPLFLLLALWADQPPVDLNALARDAVQQQTKVFDSMEKHCFMMRILQEGPSDDASRRRETRVEHVCYREGVPVYNRLEINGKPTGIKANDPFPPPNDEFRKRVERVREARKTQIDVMEQALHAFNFQWIGETVLEGRQVYIVDLKPNPGYHAASRTTEMLKSVTGRVWIDKESHNVVMAQARTFRDFSIWGGLLAKIRQGATFEMHQRPVNGVWLPYSLEQRWEGRVAMFKKIGDHVKLERSDFGLGSADHPAAVK